MIGRENLRRRAARAVSFRGGELGRFLFVSINEGELEPKSGLASGFLPDRKIERIFEQKEGSPCAQD